MLFTSLARVGVVLGLARVGFTAPTNDTDGSLFSSREAATSNTFSLERRDYPQGTANIEDYGTAFWQSVRCQPLTRPRVDRCLFYTSPKGSGSLSNTARLYAAANGYDTIWGQFPGRFYVNGLAPRQDIYSSKALRTRYFKQMSTAFASYCSGAVTVMLRDPLLINTDGIWFYSEWPTLINGGQVTTITAINTDGTNPIVIYDRNNGGVQTATGVKPPPLASYMPPKRKARRDLADDGFDVEDFMNADTTELLGARAELLARTDPPATTTTTSGDGGDDDCDDGDDDGCCGEGADCWPNGLPDYVATFNSDPDPDVEDW